MDFSQVIIPDEKLTNYLLSKTHMVGRAKAKFFRDLGFHEKNLNLLKEQLVKTLQQTSISEMNTPYGTKIIAEKLIETPVKKTAKIVTVWMLDDNNVLRFVTAYPV